MSEIALGDRRHGFGEARNWPGNGARNQKSGKTEDQHGQRHDARQHQHGAIEHRLDGRTGHGNHQRADDRAVLLGDRLVAKKVTRAGDLAAFGHGPIGEERGMERGSCGDGLIEQTLARIVNEAGRANDKVGRLLGVKHIDGDILPGDAGNGIDHVIGAEARHAAAGQRLDIARAVHDHFEIGQIDLKDLRGNAGRGADGVLGIAADCARKRDKECAQNGDAGEQNADDRHGRNNHGQSQMAEDGKHAGPRKTSASQRRCGKDCDRNVN